MQVSRVDWMLGGMSPCQSVTDGGLPPTEVDVAAKADVVPTGWHRFGAVEG